MTESGHQAKKYIACPENLEHSEIFPLLICFDKLCAVAFLFVCLFALNVRSSGCGHVVSLFTTEKDGS